MNYTSLEFLNFRNSTNLILITPHGRAGSLFVQGLLDNHPQIVSLPYFINYYDINFEYKNLNELIDKYFELNKELLQVSKYLKINLEDKEIFDVCLIKKTMYEVLDECTEVNNKDILCSLFYAYLKFLKKDISNVKFLLVHLHLYDACFNTHKFLYEIDLKHHKKIMEDFDYKLYIALTTDSTFKFIIVFKKKC